MKKLFTLFVLFTCFTNCKKDCSDKVINSCDIEEAYSVNASKVTITNGIWGTVAATEGNCMPVIDPLNTTCKTCTVKRKVRIYDYTLRSQATPSNSSGVFFDSFNTQLIAEVESDDNGFYQVIIPAGHYSIAIVEDGKLYANSTDGQGGLNPITFTGNLQKVNLTMTYKAVF